MAHPTLSQEDSVRTCLEEVTRIHSALEEDPLAWTNRRASALSVISNIDSTSLLQQDAMTQQQKIFVLKTLQNLAFQDPDQHPIPEIATWCLAKWLLLLEANPDNMSILKNIGQNWLWKAQPALARIEEQERRGSDSSTDSNSRFLCACGGEEAREIVSWIDLDDTEDRVGGPDYVEARGILEPATEYLGRAVEAAEAQSLLTGELLVTAAESYMSLGNVTHPRQNTTYFHRAVRILRQATHMEYVLPEHLQQYLEDYGRYVD